MPTVEEILGGLADEPPAPPRPVGEVRARARRRVRRRRALAGAAVILAVAAAGVAVGTTVGGEDDGQDVYVDGGSPTSSTTEPPATDGRLTLEPATGQAPWSIVEVRGVVGPLASFEAGVTVQQCAREALFVEDDFAPRWCTDASRATRDGASLLTVAPTVRGGDGVVECKREVGRCIVAVLDVETGKVRQWTELDVTDSPMPDDDGVAVVVHGDEGTVADGETVLVTVTGVETGEPIAVRQCLEGQVDALAIDGGGLQCSEVRALRTEVQSGPETQVEFTVFHDVFAVTDVGEPPAWTECSCALLVEAGAGLAHRTVVPLVLEPADDPIRPELTLEPTGPLAPGTGVTVRAGGLQPRSSVRVAVCPVPMPAGGGVGCLLADGTEALPTTVGDDGTLIVTGFRLPAPGFDQLGEDCTRAPGTCAIAVDGDITASPVTAPLDLSG